MIKFSICIPNFNYANYIGQTIESVLCQTYKDFEIVIVDNASTDNSWQVIQTYASKDDRIKAYRNSYNIGFSLNLDRAASLANNEFLLMLSSDDTMKPTALEKYHSILLQIEKKYWEKILLCSAIDIIDSNSIVTDTWYKNRFHDLSPVSIFNLTEFDANIFEYNATELMRDIFPRFSVPGPFNSTLYSKGLYECVGGYSSNNPIGPDAHFAYKCLFMDASVIFYNKPLFNYRVHNSSQLSLVSKQRNINVLFDRFIFSNAYSDDQLSKIGLKREDYQRATIETDCIRGAINALGSGDWIYATQHVNFAYAAYPHIAFRHVKLNLLKAFLVTGPFAILVVKLIYFFRFKQGYFK